MLAAWNASSHASHLVDGKPVMIMMHPPDSTTFVAEPDRASAVLQTMHNMRVGILHRKIGEAIGRTT